MGLKEKNNLLLRTEHYKTLWCFYANAMIGFWLLTSHFAFGYTHSFFGINDVISGFLLVVFCFLSLSYQRLWAPWASCMIGLWLQIAPLLFSSHDAVIYANDTLTGVLILAFSILIPGMPGKLSDKGPSIPQGWSYNPSSFPQRVPIVVLGMIGWFISRYLAAYQLGFIDTVWDPFFQEETLRILVPGTGLGAFAYSLGTLLALTGDERRWRTMPWIVILFGIFVVPLNLVSIILILVQPVVLGFWCSLCLFTAFCMMIMIAFATDEVVAVLQFLYQEKKKNARLWTIFWKGSEDVGTKDNRTPLMDESWKKIFPAMSWGVDIPLNLLFSAFLGAWLMITPWVFNFSDFLSNGDHIVGGLVIVTSVISMAEVIRKLRHLNFIFGCYLILSTIDFFFAPISPLGIFNHIIVGGFLILLSFHRGRIKESYGAWNKFVR